MIPPSSLDEGRTASIPVDMKGTSTRTYRVKVPFMRYVLPMAFGSKRRLGRPCQTSATGWAVSAHTPFGGSHLESAPCGS